MTQISTQSHMDGASGSASLSSRYSTIRNFSLHLAAPLSAEDCLVQSMPDVSPTKWHLAHTTWFFETFVLKAYNSDYKEFHPHYGFLYNSYYNSVGERHPRPKRGLLSRPSYQEVLSYRKHVDDQMQKLLDGAIPERCGQIIDIGLHHEQQHQELILTDIKHVLSCNSLYPVYKEKAQKSKDPVDDWEWIDFEGGVVEIGHKEPGFCYDNETPLHQYLLCDYRLSSRLITAAEYLEFIEDGGYSKPEYWLSDGWYAKENNDWIAPLYWEKNGSEWGCFTLAGYKPLVPSEPVAHVSYFEADAFARWKGVRLPTEVEWENASQSLAPSHGNFVESEEYHPLAVENVTEGQLSQMFGDVWEWTSSPYTAYPGYKPEEGALGEYNGKFMCNQFVLRGGSCATSRTHIRRTYRNFFPPDARWQFSGIRLADQQ